LEAMEEKKMENLMVEAGNQSVCLRIWFHIELNFLSV
jgi:hypothetical protein